MGNKKFLEDKIINYAKELGFDLVKILPAQSLDENLQKSFYDWIYFEYAGDMEYMKKEPEKRADLLKKFPDAKSIIVLGMNYFMEEKASPTCPNDLFGRKDSFWRGKRESSFAKATADKKEKEKAEGKVARYAWGRDYHKVIELKLKKLKEFILRNVDSGETQNDIFKMYVDYGPILERAYAVKAGFGFIGRNTCLITKEFGSWVFLAELITNLEIQEKGERKEDEKDHFGCGNCVQCLQVCPTGALETPYKLNAKKCISYLTIENKGSIPEKSRPLIGDWLYGCDLCQEVCPYNARAKATKEPDFKKQILGDTQILKDVLSIRTDQEFRQKFAGSPVIRIKRKGLLRNACVVAGNLKDRSLLPVLEECLKKDPEPLIREHAKWGIRKINNEK